MKKVFHFQVEAKPEAQIVWKQGLREIGQEVGTLRLVTVTDFAVWWNISLTTQPDGNVTKVNKVSRSLEKSPLPSVESKT